MGLRMASDVGSWLLFENNATNIPGSPLNIEDSETGTFLEIHPQALASPETNSRSLGLQKRDTMEAKKSEKKKSEASKPKVVELDDKWPEGIADSSLRHP